MADASTLVFDLIFISGLMGKVASGADSLSADQAGEIATTLDEIARRCADRAEELASLERQVAVMRRWFTKRDFGEEFARLEAIRAGVRAGGVIDLVTVFERERALAATMHGGAA